MELSGDSISFGAAAISATVAALTLRFMVSRHVHARIDAVQTLSDTKNEATRKEAELRSNEVSARESKARHDLANELSNQLAVFAQSIKQLERDAVRKDEVTAMEGRQTAIYSKIEGKVDHLQERLNKLDVVEAQGRTNAAVLEKILDRLDRIKIV